MYHSFDEPNIKSQGTLVRFELLYHLLNSHNNASRVGNCVSFLDQGNVSRPTSPCSCRKLTVSFCCLYLSLQMLSHLPQLLYSIPSPANSLQRWQHHVIWYQKFQAGICNQDSICIWMLASLMKPSSWSTWRTHPCSLLWSWYVILSVQLWWLFCYALFFNSLLI